MILKKPKPGLQKIRENKFNLLWFIPAVPGYQCACSAMILSLVYPDVSDCRRSGRDSLQMNGEEVNLNLPG
jgi:hypothetical protein